MWILLNRSPTPREKKGAKMARDITLEDRVFMLLKGRGPLDPAQIAVELLEPVEDILVSLRKLRSQGVANIRPDPDVPLPADEELQPWGLHFHSPVPS